MLLVVLGLLLLLMVLGFTAITFTSQEHESATFYAEGSKKTGVEIESDGLFDFALSQLLIGPAENNKQSALWPGRHSLIPNMIGMFQVNQDGSNSTTPLDRHPFNGVGVNLISGPKGEPIVDNDFDGQADAPLIINGKSYNYLNFNLSPVTGVNSLTRLQINQFLPAPDVDYTYPDINNIWLAHYENVQVNPGDPTKVIPVLIPSFHRPQYLRTTTGPVTDWDTNTAYASRVLCPHPGHFVFGNSNLARFMGTGPDGQPGDANVDDDGDGIIDNDSEIGWNGSDDEFPFKSSSDSTVRDPNGNGTPREVGVWSINGKPTSVFDQRLKNFELHVDNRRSGIRDGVWIDVGAPMFTLPDGRKATFLVSYTVLPADGLVNLNTAGNVASLASGEMSLASAFISAFPIARSNFGLSPSEVNPFWALTGDPQNSLFLSPPVSAGNPSAALAQHLAFQKHNSSYLMNRIEMANLESMFLLWGRPKFDIAANGSATINSKVEGRWGELDALETGWNGDPADPNRWLAFPRPGKRVASATTTYSVANTGDDDFNQYTGVAFDGNNQTTYADLHPTTALREYNLRNSLRYPLVNNSAGLGSQTLWSFGHPSDFVGGGNSVGLSANQYGYTSTLMANPNDPLTPLRWIQYSRYGGGSVWGSALTGQLVQNANPFGLLDNPSEMIVDRRYKVPGVDQLFSPDEMFALHASVGDYNSAGVGSRLRQLAPFNFDSSVAAATIRKRFTTESWDRTQHSFHPDPQRVDPSKPNVNWEFNANIDGDDRSEFPPQVFAATPATQAAAPVLDAREPFRNALRAAIGVELSSTQYNAAHANSLNYTFAAGYNRQMRLDINRLVTIAGRNTTPPFAEFPIVQRTSLAPSIVENPVRFRRLTPHPVSLATTAIPQTYIPTQPPSNANMTAFDQEYWARRDRQQMARDIFVMLYTLGAPASSGNPLATSGFYQEWQLVEMAQFAVNVVDELDPDDVITKFEFDADLSNGWDRDDNPYSTTDSQDRTLPSGIEAVVFGVETQSLTLSEVMCLYQAAAPNGVDHSSTAYNDSASASAHRWFTHVEVRNASPYPVRLDNGSWRLSVHAQTIPETTGAVKQTAELRTSVIFKKNPRVANSNFIGAGDLYTIGSMGRDDLELDQFNVNGTPVVRSADFRMDSDDTLDETFTRISPNIAEATTPTKSVDAPPGCSLDLIHNTDYNKNYYQLFDYKSGTTDVSNDPQSRGSLLRGPGLDPTQPIKLILERRAHGGRGSPAVRDAAYDDDNPWVKVDEFTIQQAAQLVIDKGDSGLPQATIRTNLQTLFSTERDVPLVRKKTSQSTGVAALPNTVGQRNSVVAPTVLNVWQPHFDRDFTSVMDLLNIPLYGPHQLTDRLALNNQLLTQSVDPAGAAPSAAVPPAPIAYTAAAKFLQPTHPLNIQTFDNRWHRILELLEVPSSTRDMLEAQFAAANRESTTRVPGKIQLNSLAYSENLHALLDDPKTFSISYVNGQPMILDARENGRDWWFEFLRTRDGFDPLTGLNLPGSPAARPFRSPSHPASPLSNGQFPESTENSLLRRLVYDQAAPLQDHSAGLATATNYAAVATSYRRLFESRIQNDVTSSTNEVDPYARHRLLRKIANNSTNRGNVFNVWITVGFFQAHQPDPTRPDWVVVGKKLDDQPDRRGYFVIDRSLLEDAFVPNTTNPNFAGTFDFRKFVQYRRVLQ